MKQWHMAPLWRRSSGLTAIGRKSLAHELVTAGGILNVSAANKSTGKSKQINITNKMDRLSQAEVHCMVQEAVKFRAEDKSSKTGIEAKSWYVLVVVLSLSYFARTLPT